MDYYQKPPPKPKRPETPEQDVSGLIPITITYRRPDRNAFSYAYYLTDRNAARRKAKTFLTYAREPWTLELAIGHIPPEGSGYPDPLIFDRITRGEVAAALEADRLERARKLSEKRG